MHPYLLPIFAFLTSTLILPCFPARLSPRDHYGWIGSFDASDCHGPKEGKRPELTPGECYPFTPSTSNVGINFGTGIHSFSSLTLFVILNCTLPYKGTGPEGFQAVVKKEDYTATDGYGCWHPDTTYDPKNEVKILGVIIDDNGHEFDGSSE